MSLKLYKRKTREGYVWWVRGTISGARYHESTGTDREDLAKEFRAKREAEIYRAAIYGTRHSVPFATAARDALEFEERGHHQKAYVRRLTDYFGARMVESIDQAAVDRAVADILPPGSKPSTRRRNLIGPLTAILNHAHRRGYCDRPEFHLPKVPKPKTAFLAPEQVEALIAGAAPHLRPLLTFLVCTGARVSEALDLDWSDVRLDERTVVLRDTKQAMTASRRCAGRRGRARHTGATEEQGVSAR